ncbi:MAG: alanine racemase [Verrucomicrobiota bacterium]
MTRCWCEINLSAIRHNIAFVRKQVGADTAIMPMLKADAYGHGTREIASVFRSEKCEWIGCANVSEGANLRRYGIRTPILLLSGFLQEELEEIAGRRLSITLSSIEEARIAQRHAKRTGYLIGCHVKVDTGMGRLGCQPELAPELLHYVEEASHLNLEGFYSHYACADESKAFTMSQWKAFSAIPAPDSVLRHICNSAGMLALPQSHQDIVRPGLIVFGVSPLPKFQTKLRPALSWKTRVVGVREVPKGTTISYGATFTAPHRMKIATLSVGYGDGLSRQLGNCGKVLIRGHSCAIRGRVTMDQVVVEVPRPLDVRKGDVAILLGKSGKTTITAVDMANWAQTIPYEIWCHITGRVVKEYTS